MPLLGATLTGLVSAQGSATLIYTNIPGLPQSEVPGLVGVAFKPDATSVNGTWGFSAKEEDPIPALPGNFFDDALDLTQLPQPTGAVAAAPGESWNFQAWHRDLVAGNSISNFTNGVEVTFE